MHIVGDIGFHLEAYLVGVGAFQVLTDLLIVFEEVVVGYSILGDMLGNMHVGILVDMEEGLLLGLQH